MRTASRADLSLPSHEDGPLEAEYRHLLALPLLADHDGQNARLDLYLGCVPHLSFAFQADARPAALPV